MTKTEFCEALDWALDVSPDTEWPEDSEEYVRRLRTLKARIEQGVETFELPADGQYADRKPLLTINWSPEGSDEGEAG